MFQNNKIYPKRSNDIFTLVPLQDAGSPKNLSAGDILSVFLFFHIDRGGGIEKAFIDFGKVELVGKAEFTA